MGLLIVLPGLFQDCSTQDGACYADRWRRGAPDEKSYGNDNERREFIHRIWKKRGKVERRSGTDVDDETYLMIMPVDPEVLT